MPPSKADSKCNLNSLVLKFIFTLLQDFLLYILLQTHGNFLLIKAVCYRLSRIMFRIKGTVFYKKNTLKMEEKE